MKTVKPKKLLKESLAWHKQEWQKVAGKGLRTDFINGLAQLSYENGQLRKRLVALEAILLAQMIGMVEIKGDMHLLECAKRGAPKAACTCGSRPDDK